MTHLEPSETGTFARAEGTLRLYAADAVASAFALYWVSNLILWFPWSYSETLGITLMLTLIPVLWAFGISALMLRWPRPSIWAGAAWTAVTMLLVSVISDLLFFGVIRDAGDELLRPTTYAGYAWVFALPFLIVAVARRWLERKRTPVTSRDVVISLCVGLVALASIIVIIAFDLRLTSA